MGEYFWIVNATKKVVANNGKHFGKYGEFEFEYEVKLRGWDKDEVYMVGDSLTFVKYQEFVLDEEDEQFYEREGAIVNTYGQDITKDIENICRECKICENESGTEKDLKRFLRHFSEDDETMAVD